MSPASRLAWPRSWVDITTLTPRALTARTMSSIALVAYGSRLAVGSSRNSTAGSRASARASASRCCSPPDSRRAGRSPSPSSPTSVSNSAVRSWRLGARDVGCGKRVAYIAGGATPEHGRALEHDGAARRRCRLAATPSDASAREGDKSHGGAQQRGFAAAVRTDQDRRRACRNRQSDTVEDRHLAGDDPGFYEHKGRSEAGARMLIPRSVRRRGACPRPAR